MPYKSAEAQREYMIRYRQENLERLCENDRNRYHADLEESKRRQRQRYKENPEKYKKSTAAYRSANKDECCRRDRLSGLIIKIETFLHYSNNELKCNKCEERRLAALTIDHINGDGRKHRKSLKLSGGKKFYRWLRKQNYPSDYQVLCSNCNWKKYQSNIKGQSRASKWRMSLKEQVMQRLGGNCDNCKTTDIDVLTVHHINDDGAAHRRLIESSGIYQYKYIIENDCFENLRCLCFSCNDSLEWSYNQEDIDVAFRALQTRKSKILI